MCAVVDNWIDSYNAFARHSGALRVIRLIGDRSCLRFLAPLCIQGGIALNENLILRLIERSVATVLAGAPAQENLALRSLKTLGRKNVSVSVLCVESTVNRRPPVRGSIRVIRYAELLVADVIRIQHNIGTDFRIEVEQLVGIIPLFTRACRPTDKLHTIDFNGFRQLVYSNRITKVDIDYRCASRPILVRKDGDRMLDRHPLCVERHRMRRHRGTEVERSPFTKLIVIPAGKLVAFRTGS